MCGRGTSSRRLASASLRGRGQEGAWRKPYQIHKGLWPECDPQQAETRASNTLQFRHATRDHDKLAFIEDGKRSRPGYKKKKAEARERGGVVALPIFPAQKNGESHNTTSL